MAELTVGRSILEANDRLAEDLRARFRAANVKVINIISSPGAGKTTLLEKTLTLLKDRLAVGVIEGDIQTTEDAQRVAACGVKAVQIETKGACHLDGNMLSGALAAFDLNELDLLIIENVGNLVCPVEFDLGEDLKVAVLSVTEGDDKPSKYPLLFSEAGVLIVNKVDLLPYIDCDIERIHATCRALNPSQVVFDLSCRTGEGLEAWVDWLEAWVRAGQGRLSPMAAPPPDPLPVQTSTARATALVTGVVQGVGFRPFVYNLARALGLSGSVSNTAAGVELAVQGSPAILEEFFRRLAAEAPPLADIQEVRRATAEVRPVEQGFTIEASQPGARRTLISPDVAVCEACLAEMNDPADRRFRYPFINCTHCGPRYTIIKDLPYDRPQTTMAPFVMCPECQAEYDDPANRRFHAQPNACPVCGPRLWLADAAGVEKPCPDPVKAAADALRQGKIVAIKGLGGFHLAVDAFNETAVARLRARKHREEKPLALMVPDLAQARALVELDPLAEEALLSRQRPIVLAPVKPEAGVAPSVNPTNRLLGVMLPYTPLHHLLLAEGFKALVITSGNVSDEPICLDNQEAICRIGGQASRGAIADLMLLHDRDIYLRGDDSVVRVLAGRLRQVRRSRGFAPAPLMLPQGLVPDGCPPILATGAQLKNTLCLLRGREAFLSQHVGDLENLETLAFFELTAGHLQRILEAKAEIIACDLHPDYLSTQWAQAQGLPLVRVQHHHAHAVAVMAEAGLTGHALALSLDGTGSGPDRTIWGGELLRADPHAYTRLGRLRPFRLPGGEAAVKEPWRIGLALLLDVFGDQAAGLDLGVLRARGQHLPLITQMAAKGLNSPLTSSLGRLFDGVAAISGLRLEVAYEGQAAIELEQALDPGESDAYLFSLLDEGGLLVLDWRPAITALVDDLNRGASVGQASARFHHGLVEALAAWATRGAQTTGLSQVCLGGGCLMNAELLCGLPRRLKQAGLTGHTPALVPAGDGGLALGQAVAVAQAWGRGLLNQTGETVLGPPEQENLP